MPGGRPSKLDKETKDALLQGIQAGLTYELACDAAGIHYNTFRSWVKKGETAQSGQYVEFLEDLKRAEGQGATRLIGLIQRAANIPEFWTAAAWILERRYPRDYGRQVVQVEGNPENPVVSESKSEVKVSHASNEPLDDYLRELEEIEAADEAGAGDGEADPPEPVDSAEANS